jgi:hypothetical protein
MAQIALKLPGKVVLRLHFKLGGKLSGNLTVKLKGNLGTHGNAVSARSCGAVPIVAVKLNARASPWPPGLRESARSLPGIQNSLNVEIQDLTPSPADHESRAYSSCCSSMSLEGEKISHPYLPGPS